MTGKGIFDFLKEDDEIATSGNPESTEDRLEEDSVEEIATSGNPLLEVEHQGLTKTQVLDAQRQAESPRGLDMNKFMQQTGVEDLNFEELLKYKVK